MMEIWKLTVDCIEYREIGGVSCMSERGCMHGISYGYNSGKNDIEKR
jgi:hypothetical protein